MDNEQRDRAEWQRITADMQLQEPPIAPEEWSRQLAIECIFARILFLFEERGENQVEEFVLGIPPGRVSEKTSYVNVFRRIEFILRGLRRNSRKAP